MNLSIFRGINWGGVAAWLAVNLMLLWFVSIGARLNFGSLLLIGLPFLALGWARSWIVLGVFLVIGVILLWQVSTALVVPLATLVFIAIWFGEVGWIGYRGFRWGNQ